MGPSYPKYINPYFSGPSRNNNHSLGVEEPVDAFIDKLTEGQETTSQFIITSLQADSSVALLRAQELTAAITTT